MTTLAMDSYTMFQAESSFMPPSLQQSVSVSNDKFEKIIEAIAEGITTCHLDEPSTESTVESSPVNTTDTTTTTTATATTTTTIPEATVEEEEEEGPILLNKIRYEPTEQYDANGRPVEFPFPPEFLPPTPVLSTGEEWQEDIVSEEEFNTVMETMNLPALPEDYHALEALYVPKQLVEASAAYILYRATQKQGNDLGKARRLQADMSRSALAFFGQFGIYAEDKNERLVNWKSVFYVTHLLHTIPTASAYTIEDDLFSGSQGMKEYNLDNWHANKTHAIRMIVISSLSGDNVEAIFTLDLLMRYRRSMTRESQCTTFHDLGKGVEKNQSLCFVAYLLDDDSFRASWLSVGLNSDVAAKIPANRQLPYYDGPSCNTCGGHHKKLLYCTKCYCTQYCNLSCLKKDKRAHVKFCSRNRVSK